MNEPHALSSSPSLPSDASPSTDISQDTSAGTVSPHDGQDYYALYQAERRARLQSESRVHRLEQRLEQAEAAEQVLDALMECVPEGIDLASAPPGSVVRASRHGAKRAGRDRQAREGIPVEEHVDRRAILEADGVAPARNEDLPLTRAVQQGEGDLEEAWGLQRPSGERTAMRGNAGPVREPQGGLAGAATVWRDIAERKQRQERLHVLASARCLLWSADIWTDTAVPIRWLFRFPSLEAAHRFLPIGLRPDQTFVEGWWDARLEEDRQETDRAALAAILQGRDYEVEYRSRLADGTIRWTHEDVQVETVEEGKRWRAVGVCTDITERKQAEEERRLQEQRLRLAMRSGGMGFFEWDVETGRTVWSEEMAAIFGISLEEHTGTHAFWEARMHPEDLPGLQDHLRRELAARCETIHSPEHRIVRPDGEVRWHRSMAVVTYDARGHPCRMTGVGVDITEYRRAHEALQQREALLDAFFQASPGILNIMDDQLRYLRTDPLTPTYFGLDRQSIVGKAMSDLAPEIIRDYGATMRRVIETGEPSTNAEVRVPVPSHPGELVHWRVSYFRVPLPGGKHGLGIVGVDVTDMKRAGAALRESEARYRAFFESGVFGAAECDPETGCFLRVNDRFCQITGYTREELLSGDYENLTLAEERAEDWRRFSALVHGTGAEDSIDKRIRRKDGRIAWVRAVTRVIRNASGRAVHTAGIVLDISDQKAAELALRESEEQLRLATEAAQIGVWSWTPGTSQVRVSANWRRLFGVAEDQAVTFEMWRDALHPDDGERAVRELNAASEEHREFNIEYRVVQPSGDVRWIVDRGRAWYDQTGHPFHMAGVNVDITEQKARQEEITHLNARLRRAMAETHHRVKNNLQTIAGMVELHLPEEGELVSVRSLRRIGQHIGSLAGLHDLLTQEARTEGDVQTVSAQAVLEKLMPVVKALLVGRELVWDVEDARLMLRQASGLAIFVNEAVSNAVKHGGSRVELSLRVEEKRAHLEVTDNGPGFPPGFDAARDANTGLGLMENVARFDLLGELVLDNALEGGARLVVTFPLVSLPDR